MMHHRPSNGSNYGPSPPPPPNFSAGGPSPSGFGGAGGPPPPPSFGSGSQQPSSGAPGMMHGPIAGRGTFVDLKVCCRGLRTFDGMPPSSFVVVYAQTSGKSEWTELNWSETIHNSASADYKSIFQMEYRFELYQQIRIVVFHRNNPSDNLRQQTLLGVTDVPLGRIVSAQTSTIELPITNVEAGPAQQQIMGFVNIAAEEIISAKKFITLNMAISGIMTGEDNARQHEYFQAKNAPIVEPPTARSSPHPKRSAASLMKKFRKNKGEGQMGMEQESGAVPAHMANEVIHNQQAQQQAQQQAAQAYFEHHQALTSGPPPFYPFITILRAPREAIAAVDPSSNDIAWEEVYKSPEIANYAESQEGFDIPPITLSEFELCEGDESRLMKIAIVRIRPGQVGKYIGEQITTFPALRRMCIDHPNAMLSLQPMGQLIVRQYEEEEKPSFYEYLRGGLCDFALMTGIDFTSSNGNPSLPSSRHYLHSPSPNEYEAAMRTVGNMLASYSSDVRIPAFGFGAIVAKDTPVSHCFPVSSTGQNDPFCHGVDGLIHAYKSTLQRVQLHGPTMFSQLLQQVGWFVTHRQKTAPNSSLAYTVVLILTDGAISDYDATLGKLIALSSRPVSVIIIGIGNENFGQMQKFDSSNGPLQRGVEFAVRPFIQFIPYNEFRGDLSMLAEKVLGKIPEQVLSYIEKVRGGAPQGSLQGPPQTPHYGQQGVGGPPPYY